MQMQAVLLAFSELMPLARDVSKIIIRPRCLSNHRRARCPSRPPEFIASTEEKPFSKLAASQLHPCFEVIPHQVQQKQFVHRVQARREGHLTPLATVLGMNRKFGGRRQPTGTPSLALSCIVVVFSLLAGASVVHNIYKPNLTLPPVDGADGTKEKPDEKE